MNSKRILLLSLIALVVVTGALITVLVWSTRHSRSVAKATVPAPTVPAQIPGVDPAAPAMRLIDVGSQASWSSDGQQLVFSGASGTGLWMFDLPTRTARALGLHGKDCAWSPAGAWIASVRTGNYDDTTNTLRRDEVWLLPAKEGAPRRVVRGGFPRWSTNGQTLFVHSHINNQILAVNLANLDAPPTVLYDKTLGWYYTVSPDEQQMVMCLRTAS